MSSIIKEKIEASIMLASYLETIGFKNGVWEFNYMIEIKNFPTYMSIWATMMHHYVILGGSDININGFISSDDTIMIIAIAEAVIKGGGMDRYKASYLDYYDLLYDEKRQSGISTLKSLKTLKHNNLPKIDSTMGGNGAAMRTGPIGLRWYKNYEKVIEESIISSIITHNFSIGFLGGMVTALFTSFAMNGIDAHLWVDEMLTLYNNKTIEKYYPKEHHIEDLHQFMAYWKRYKETRISKIKYKNSLNSFIFPEDRTEFLMSFFPDEKIKEIVNKGQSLKKFEWSWDRIGSTGLDCCIYAYDCLLMSMQNKNSKETKSLNLNDIEYCFETFMMLVCIHPGDNDTTAAVGGSWFGALCGYQDFDRDKLKNLEFYEELKKVSNKMISNK